MAIRKYRNVVQFEGRGLAGVTVLVKVAGTETLGVLYSDLAGTVGKTNPFQNDPVYGSLEFYTEEGLYDIFPTKPGYSMETLMNELVGASSVISQGPLLRGSVNGGGQVEYVGAIPQGAKDVGVFVRVVQGFGGSMGLVGFDVGDGVIQDVWGGDIGLAQGTRTRQEDFHLPPGTLLYRQQASVFLTAKGGLFDAVGSAEIVVKYRLDGP